MRRRVFITLLGGSARSGTILLTLLLAPMINARANDPPKRIGILASTSCPGTNNPGAQILLGRLAELGWVEGRTGIIDCVSAFGRFEQAPALATELVARRPDVLFGASTPVVRALMQATSTIPIVSIASDPVQKRNREEPCAPGGQHHGSIADLI